MTVLSCKNISKTFILDTILKDISFNVIEGDKIGVIGLNGSGKTTLFNILSGKLHKDSGEIYIRKDLNIGYLEQHVKIDSQKTIFDECLTIFDYLIEKEKELRSLEQKISLLSETTHIEELNKVMNTYGKKLEEFTELNGYGYKSDIRGVLIGLGFEENDFNKEINILSGGQKSRVSLAKLLLQKPDILLLDEPTNHLDIEAIDWLEIYLNDYPGAALIISHDRYFLDNVVNRIFHLENSSLTNYNTNYTNYMKQRKKDLEVKRRQFENQKKEIKRQEEIIERFMNTRDVGKVRQAQSRQKLLDQMKKLENPSENRQTKIEFHPKVESGMDVLEVNNLSKSFKDNNVFNNVSFNIYKGDKVGLIGDNGVGKTTLFKIILNELSQDSGTVKLGTNIILSYFDQEMEHLDSDKIVIDEIWDEFPKMKYQEIRTVLAQFLFFGDDVLKEVSSLSGGEKGRLSLLKIMLSDANFLLMDEPTNHLDIDSKEVLENALNSYTGTLFVISHDRYFLNKATDKIIQLTPNGATEYLGNYDYYLQKRKELEYHEEKTIEKTKTQIQHEKKIKRENQAKIKAKKRKIKDIENKIMKLEENINNLDIKLTNPELYEDHEQALKLSDERNDYQKKLDKYYEEWINITD